MKWVCEHCNKEFKHRRGRNKHIKSVHKINQPYDCKYCGKLFEKVKLSSHQVYCEHNPNKEKTKQKLSDKCWCKGTHLSEEFKTKQRKTINKKIKNGEWHTSFARHRIFEYNGIKFQGSWEIEFAKHLDKQNIKWRKPKETFSYIFEGKQRRYTPDFYIEDENCYYEIKGYATLKDVAKWKQFPFKLKVLIGEDLNNIGIKVNYRKQKLEFSKEYNCAVL